MKKLGFLDYKKMPWKNGLGTTYEITISPEDAELQKLNFDYRISMAEVSAPNQFSLFPNYQRILTVLQGSGITFNESQIKSLEIKQFSGNEDISSSPLIQDERILDLGIIYNPHRVVAHMKIINKEELHLDLNVERQKILIDPMSLSSYFFTDTFPNDLKENQKYVLISLMINK